MGLASLELLRVNEYTSSRKSIAKLADVVERESGGPNIRKQAVSFLIKNDAAQVWILCVASYHLETPSKEAAPVYQLSMYYHGLQNIDAKKFRRPLRGMNKQGENVRSRMEPCMVLG
jgi:hypothetical protein